MKSQAIYMVDLPDCMLLSLSFPPLLHHPEKKRSFQLSLLSLANLRLVLQSLILWHLSFHPLPPLFNSLPSILPFCSPPFVVRAFGENLTPVQGSTAQQGGVRAVSLNKITKGLLAIKTLSFSSIQFVMTPKISSVKELLKCSVYHLFLMRLWLWWESMELRGSWLAESSVREQDCWACCLRSMRKKVRRQ